MKARICRFCMSSLNTLRAAPFVSVVVLLLCLPMLCSAAQQAQPLDKNSLDRESRSDSTNRTVVILSLDGFRADYLSSAHTPVIDSMIRIGTSGALLPCFPTLTFPNHYSMATGLYPDHHGLVANRFYDKQYGSYSTANRKKVKDPVFYGGEPIWNTARRQSVRSAVYYWVGSETPIGGAHPHRWFNYSSSTPYTSRADSVIAWLSLPEPERPRLIMWYIEEPDHTGHLFGAEGRETAAMVAKMDSLVGYFLQKLNNHRLHRQVDFLLVSDHGMASYTRDRSVNLAHYLNRSDFQYISEGVPTLLYPKAGKEESVMAKLRFVPHAKAYRKRDLPQRLQYGSNPRVGEIVLIPDIGTYIYFGRHVDMVDGGVHGYDNANPEMLALFVAIGPDFAAGRKIQEPIPNITIYPLLCMLLGIQAAPNDADDGLARSLMIKENNR